MASQELETMAINYATRGIEADRQGARVTAISQYRKATELLLKLCALYPKAPQNVLYAERAEAYRKRIKQLEDNSRNQVSEITEKDKSTSTDQLVIAEKPNVKWEDIANLKQAKQAIQDCMIYPMKRPDLFPLGWPKGILLYGPPGCGKTLLAAAVATEIEAEFYSVDAASIMSKWLGESEKNVAELFENARKVSENNHPAIIFLDEVDSLIGARSEEVGGEVRMRNQFLKEIDGFAQKTKESNIYVIGATNKPWRLDEPFLRRFQKRIYIPLPEKEARLELFNIYDKHLNISETIALDALAQKTEGYSGSDIRDVVQSVQIKVVREFFENGGYESKTAKPRKITMDDFQEVIHQRAPSVSQEHLKTFDKWSEQFGAL